MTFFRHSY